MGLEILNYRQILESELAEKNPMFRFPQEIRRAVYTINVIESLNYSLRKITKTRAAFPNEEAALKLLWLGLRNIEKKWTMPIQNWSLAMNQMAIIFEGRMSIPGCQKIILHKIPDSPDNTNFSHYKL